MKRPMLSCRDVVSCVVCVLLADPVLRAGIARSKVECISPKVRNGRSLSEKPENMFLRYVSRAIADRLSGDSNGRLLFAHVKSEDKTKSEGVTRKKQTQHVSGKNEKLKKNATYITTTRDEKVGKGRFFSNQSEEQIRLPPYYHHRP